MSEARGNLRQFVRTTIMHFALRSKERCRALKGPEGTAGALGQFLSGPSIAHTSVLQTDVRNPRLLPRGISAYLQIIAAGESGKPQSA